MWYGSSYKNGYGGESFTFRKAKKRGGLGWWIFLAVVLHFMFSDLIHAVWMHIL